MLSGLRARPLEKTPPAVRVIGALGQCRLIKSGANLVLSRYNGNAITIGGLAQIIPAGGVSLTPTGLTIGVTYDIYAYMGASGMALEASTTAHAIDALTGVEVKIGDPTRTLVGQARTINNAGLAAFQDTPAQRFVASWFNRKLNSATNFGIGVAVGGTAFGELSTPARCELLSWAGDGMQMALVASVTQSSTNGTAETGIGVDSTTVSSTEEAKWQAYVNGALGALSVTQPTAALAEGYHFFAPLGKVNAGGTTATFLKFSTTVYLMN